MAFTDLFKNISSNNINLPVVGAISIPILIGGGLLLFLLLRKKRVTSITTRYGK